MDYRKYIEDTLSEIEEYYKNMALKNEHYKLVYNTPFKDLPLLINHESELVRNTVEAKLNNKSIISCSYTHPFCWELEIDVDIIKELSFKDGIISVLIEIARKNGWKDLETKALDCLYNI